MSNADKRQDLELLAEYDAGLRKKPRLRYLFFELTDACNLRCLHCGSNSSPSNRTYLPFRSIQSVLEDVAAHCNPGEIMICLTGGEPMLHPDFYRVVRHARKLGFSCGITSNGTLISPRAAHKMVIAGVQSVSFSLDGMEDTHDWFRSKPGAFRQTLAGIRNLTAAAQGSMVLQITSVIHQKNIHQLEELYDLARELGMNSFRPINLEPIGRALGQGDLLLPREQYLHLLRFIQSKRQGPGIEVTYGCSHYLPLDYERTVRDHYFQCASGIYVGSVLCNGDIFSCLDIPRRPELIQGNLREISFCECWETRFQEFRQDRSLCSDFCRECSERRYCRGDSAHTWDYGENQPLLCLHKLLTEPQSI